MEDCITIKDQNPVIQNDAYNMQVEDKISSVEVICNIGSENQGSMDVCIYKITKIEKKIVFATSVASLESTELV